MLKPLFVLIGTLFVSICSPTFAADRASNQESSASFDMQRLGLQLYSLREQFAKDVPGTLNKVRDMGFKYVETAGTYGLSPAKFRSELDSRGLIAVSAHFPFEKFRDDIEGVVQDAKTLGVKYAGCAWIAHSGDFTEKDCRKAVDVFNKAGEVLAKHGIRLFYHIHGYEFQPYGSETLFDLMAAETKPECVTFEMDVFWVVHGGANPVSLFEKHKGRFDLVHLKDMEKGTITKKKVLRDVALGTGQIDYRRTLAAGLKSGVKWYFIEDESTVSETQIPQSILYLKEVKF